MRILPLFLIVLSLSGLGAADVRSQTSAVLGDIGTAFLAARPGSAFKSAVAVLPLRVPESLAGKGIETSLGAWIKERLLESTIFVLVERDNLPALLAEMDLGLTGLVDPASAAQAGELLGAEFILQGSLGEQGNDLLLALDLVDVAKGTIVATANRTLAREDLVRDADQYLRDAFRSQYGISLWYAPLMSLNLPESKVPDYGANNVGVQTGHSGIGGMRGGVSYRVLPWLSLDLGVVNLDSTQLYFSEDGKVQSPLSTVLPDRSIRYSMFHGLGPTAGLSLAWSPHPQVNLSLGGSALVLINHSLEHWFMDYLRWDFVPAAAGGPGTVNEVRRDIKIVASTNAPFVGANLSFKGDWLISNRLSLGASADFLWFPPYIPERYDTGDQLRTTNNPTRDGLDRLDWAGYIDFMSTSTVKFFASREDGTLNSDLIVYQILSLGGSFWIAVHF